MTVAALQIEVVYAEPQRAIVKSYRVVPGSRVADVMHLAAMDPDFSAVDLKNSTLGIFGRVIRADHPLSEGDRIEIYRPLTADPKTARRDRAKQAHQR